MGLFCATKVFLLELWFSFFSKINTLTIFLSKSLWYFIVVWKKNDCAYRKTFQLIKLLKFQRFWSSQVKPSVERHVSTENSSRSQQPPQASFPWLPGVRNRQFQFVGSTNPDTGVPSPEASTSQAYNQAAGLVKPVSARVVSATSTSGGSSSLAYNPVTYTGKCCMRCSSPLHSQQVLATGDISRGLMFYSSI